MIIKGLPGLLGDSLGTLPALIELAKNNNGLKIYLNDDAFDAKQIYEMIPKKYNVVFLSKEDKVSIEEEIINFNLSKSFDYAFEKKLHMNQANFEQFNLAFPLHVPKPELEFDFIENVPECDYVLAPFSRSLPETQKWNQDFWNKLVDMMPDKKFITLGNSKYDPTHYIFEKPHVKNMYDRPLVEVFNLLKKCKKGVLSVVTGISHFCFSLDVKNYLFYNQHDMIWGKNPDAIYLDKVINSYTPEEIKNILLK